MQLSSVSSTDFPVEICRRARTCSLETRVRCRNRGLSRRSEDYDVRILPTARGYYGRAQLPRNPDRRNDGGDVVHDPRSAEATRPHSRSSFWPVHELAVTFSSPYTEIIPRGSFLSFPPSLPATIVRCMYPPGSGWNEPEATTKYWYQPSSIQAMPYLHFCQFNSQGELFLIYNRSLKSKRTEMNSRFAGRITPTVKSYLKYL